MDEARTFSPTENIALLLKNLVNHPQALPAQVRLVLTGRFADPDLQRTFRPADLDLGRDAPAGVEDVVVFARQRLTEQFPDQAEAAAHAVAEASLGNFLYAQYVTDDLLSGENFDLTDMSLPDGLEGVYRSFIQRELERRQLKWEESDFQELLGLLAASRQPGLTRGQLEGITTWKWERLDGCIHDVYQFLAGPRLEGPFQIYHQSFREFLLEDAEYPVYPGAAHARIGEYFSDRHRGKWAQSQDEYALQHTFNHLLAACSVADVAPEKLDGLTRRVVSLATTPAYLKRIAALKGRYTAALQVAEARRLKSGWLTTMHLGLAELAAVFSGFRDTLRQRRTLSQSELNQIDLTVYEASRVVQVSVEKVLQIAMELSGNVFGTLIFNSMKSVRTSRRSPGNKGRELGGNQISEFRELVQGAFERNFTFR